MLIILLLSIYFIISSKSWFLIWLGLELNTLIFLLLNLEVCNKKTEFEFKYFYIQFLGSSLFLSSWIWVNKTILFYSMMMKLILFPFLFWIINLMKWVDAKSIWILIFLQKIGPICVLMSLKIVTQNSGKIFLLMNFFISIMLGILKSNLIDLLILSSVSNVVMIFYLSSHSLFFLIFMFLYLFISSMVWLNIKYFNHQSFFINFIIIMGMPPSLLFISKIYMFTYLSYNLLYSMAMMLIMSGLIFLYMKIFFNLFNKKFFKFTLYTHFSSYVFMYSVILGMMLM
uniref:NADH-ubiquinone oxidoreductase chain 2 n=1 Tax=Liposcelis nr. bostrychophila AZ TaxID=1643344 RepID=A0A0F6QK91_9NEOP|nr:NADH dehydrogenase subunit 2 [Liposcelis nr. bostrychophila AZ]